MSPVFESVSVPVPALVNAPELLTTPEIVVFPVPSMVRAFAVFTAPLIVRRFPELFLQVWAFPTFKEALIVSVKAFALSTRMPRPAVPLIVLPCSVSVKPESEIVTFCPTLPVIQIPPALAFPARFGWLLNALLNSALSPADGAPPVQLEFVPQVVLVVPVQTRSAAKTACGAKNKINKNARGDGKIDCRPKRLFPRPRRRIWGRI